MSFKLLNYIQMINSVVYTPQASRHSGASSFSPSKSPLFQIVFAKAATVVLLFLLGDIFPQILATIIVAIVSGLQFWITKNLGRMYLQASWCVDCSGEEDVWIYQANFKAPSQYQEIFWYSQIIYAVALGIGIVLVAAAGKWSLAAAGLIAFMANYVNFFAFSKIITLRNSGILDKIANDAGAQGQMKETIRLPMVHRSRIGGQMRSSAYSNVQQFNLNPLERSGASHVMRSSRQPREQRKDRKSPQQYEREHRRSRQKNKERRSSVQYKKERISLQ